eukprot:COSAG01_NODE_7721_length_3084_cov_53.575544_5_plen_57_part_00
MAVAVEMEWHVNPGCCSSTGTGSSTASRQSSSCTSVPYGTCTVVYRYENLLYVLLD